MRSVLTILVLMAAVFGGMYFKNYVPRFAGWNLFVLIGLSFVGAVLLYYVFPDYIPEGRQNYGTMVDPVRPVPDLALSDAAGVALAPRLATAGAACAWWTWAKSKYPSTSTA